jgi:hypothetical protein
MTAAAAVSGFKEQARISQAVRRALMDGEAWVELSDDVREALEQTAHHMAAIASGSPLSAQAWSQIVLMAELFKQYPAHPTIPERALIAGGWTWHVGGSKCPIAEGVVELLDSVGMIQRMHAFDAAWSIDQYWRAPPKGIELSVAAPAPSLTPVDALKPGKPAAKPTAPKKAPTPPPKPSIIPNAAVTQAASDSAKAAMTEHLASASAMIDPTGKPNWQNAPAWAMYLTQNAAGVWVFFRNKPYIIGKNWVSQKGEHQEFNSGDIVGNWRQSLEEAPGLTST